MTLHVRQRYMLILTLSKLLLLCILAGFITLPLWDGNDDLIELNTVNIQIARAEYFASAVQTLEYRSISYHSEAISGMEVNLPTLQQVHNGLLNGDRSLGLNAPSPTVAQTLVASNADYSALVAALKAILAHPSDRPDPTQVDIVMSHAQPYAVALYQVSFALTHDAEVRKAWLIAIELVLALILFGDVLIGYIGLVRPALKAAQETEQQKENKKEPDDHSQ